MPKASPSQTAFTVGEVSPQILAREDVENYRRALSTCLNGLPLVQGGWTRRPGTLFLKTTKFGGSKQCIVLPFEFSTEQAYILELGENYMRFFTLQGILTETAQNIENISQTNPGVITITGHGYSNGDRLHLDGDIGGMHQLRFVEVIVANAAANTFDIQDIYGNDIDTTNFDAYTSGGTVGKPLEEATPYLEADLSGLKITQTADQLYIFSPAYETLILTRQSATSFTLSTADFRDGPYAEINTTSTTMTPSGTTGSITITASSTSGVNEGLGFQPTDVGRFIRIQHASTWGHAEITSYTSTTVVGATVVAQFGSATASTEWRLGLFSETTGYPSCGTFYEDRLWVGGADVFPEIIAASRTGKYTIFSPSDTDGTVADDFGITYGLNASQVNRVVWLSDNEKALIGGTTGGEWPIRASQNSEALTPSNINAKRSTRHGSKNIAPAETGFSTLFVDRAGRRMREIQYQDARDGFSAPDTTVLSEHITNPGVAGVTYQRNPQSVVYSWRTDGVMLGFTYERDAEVYAWHRHELGGVSDAEGTHPLVESMATIPTATGEWDESYMIVKRFINGRDERYVELLTKLWQVGDEQEDAFQLDCGITQVESGGTTEVLGLSHLEGEEISVLLDGAESSPQTVTNGKIDLDTTGVIATVGYNYNSDGKLMPFIDGAADGSALTKKSVIHRVGFWLLDTLGLKVGPSEDELTEILFRRWGGLWGNATPLFTGAVRESFEGDYDRVAEVYFRANGPFPATVLAVTRQGNTQDDT